MLLIEVVGEKRARRMEDGGTQLLVEVSAGSEPDEQSLTRDYVTSRLGKSEMPLHANYLVNSTSFALVYPPPRASLLHGTKIKVSL